MQSHTALKGLRSGRSSETPIICLRPRRRSLLSKRLTRRIVSTQILVEWSDNPKMEVLLHDMPTDLALQFDHWLEDIEAEENAKDRGGVR